MRLRMEKVIGDLNCTLNLAYLALLRLLLLIICASHHLG